MMKVVQVGMGWFPDEPGGLSRMTYHLADALPGAGVRVCNLVTGAPDVEARSAGRARAFARPSASLAARLGGARAAVRRALSPGDVDLVASHFALYSISWLDVARAQPLVVHFHGPWASEARAERVGGVKMRAQRAVERAVFRRADAFIVLSEAFRDLLCRDYRVPPERVHIVPGGVDADAFATDVCRAEARERLGLTGEGPLLASVRRLARRMGLEQLIDAMPAVRRAHPGARLAIAGGGPLRAELEARVRARALGDVVHLLGVVPEEDLRLLYRAADLTVVPTRALEGFGLVTIESLASGTPVLVTPVGGLPEIVRPLDPRLVTEGTDEEALTRGLLGALGARETLPDAAACRRWVRERYDWPRIAERTAAVYADVLARREAS